jgi:hypothetical protein
MKKRDILMFSLYLIGIALGVQMMTDGWYWGGLFQVVFLAFFFSLRLWMTFSIRAKRKT